MLQIVSFRSPSMVLLPMMALMLMAPAGYATPIKLVADLSGLNEIPATNSPGIGHADIVLDAAAHTIQLNITFSGLVSPDSAAHIHCCLPAPLNNTTNVGVATAVPAFPLFPLQVTSGTYSSAVFDLTQSTFYNSAFVTLQGGLPQAEASLVAGLLDGKTYLNIHSGTFPLGEIRGFVVQAVPEPSSLVLLGSGVFALLLYRRK